MSDQTAPPDTGALDAALVALQQALDEERADNSADMAKAQEAFNALKNLYDDQSTKYSWAEKQRQEFWRLYNWLLGYLGVPRQSGSTPYTLEQFQAELAKLPSAPDVSKLIEERDVALRDAASYRENATALARKAQAAEERAVKAEAEAAQLRGTKADVQAEVTRIKTTLERVEKLLK